MDERCYPAKQEAELLLESVLRPVMTYVINFRRIRLDMFERTFRPFSTSVAELNLFLPNAGLTHDQLSGF